MSEEDWRVYFPDDDCIKVVAELSVWTSVADCLCAARFIERRPRSDDTQSEILVIPFRDDDAYEKIFVHCLAWLIRSYRTPSSKVRLAALLDPKIAPQTCETLLNAHCRATIDQGP